jgi:hypothetical protein
MNEIAVTAILKEYGTWIKTEPFVKLVSEKRDVKVRQAYNLIKKAFDKKEILKSILSDGKTTLYGLAEFGPNQFGPSLEVQPAEKPSKIGWLERRELNKNLEAERRNQEQKEQGKRDLIDEIHFYEHQAETIPFLRQNYLKKAAQLRETYEKLHSE